VSPRLIDDSGVERVDVDDPVQTRTWCSLAGSPPSRELWRQIEVG